MMNEYLNELNQEFEQNELQNSYVSRENIMLEDKKTNCKIWFDITIGKESELHKSQRFSKQSEENDRMAELMANV